MFIEYLRRHPLQALIAARPTCPFPPASDRAAWEGLPEAKRAALSALAEQYRAVEYPVLTAGQYMAFARTGDRTAWEQPCFLRRRKLIAALMGLVGARLAIRRQKKADALIKAKEQAIVQLRDAAVAMADGHLETRADASAEGELGELGRAVNNLSDQLSRNMYTLIVERNRLRNMLNGLSEGIVAWREKCFKEFGKNPTIPTKQGHSHQNIALKIM